MKKFLGLIVLLVALAVCAAALVACDPDSGNQATPQSIQFEDKDGADRSTYWDLGAFPYGTAYEDILPTFTVRQYYSDGSTKELAAGDYTVSYVKVEEEDVPLQSIPAVPDAGYYQIVFDKDEFQARMFFTVESVVRTDLTLSLPRNEWEYDEANPTPTVGGYSATDGDEPLFYCVSKDAFDALTDEQKAEYWLHVTPMYNMGEVPCTIAVGEYYAYAKIPQDNNFTVSYTAVTPENAFTVKKGTVRQPQLSIDSDKTHSANEGFGPYPDNEYRYVVVNDEGGYKISIDDGTWNKDGIVRISFNRLNADGSDATVEVKSLMGTLQPDGTYKYWLNHVFREPALYTITVSLKDKTNFTWYDGTTEDSVFRFEIKEKKAVSVPSVHLRDSVTGTDGVDFVTLHCGITRKTIDQIRKHKRKMNIVSRGGSLVFAWMSMTGEENPFYEYFDEILDICEQYDVTISLGDACRPGCLADATDVCQIEELVRLGELTKRAWDHNVQVMVEGPGHVPLNQVAANMEVQKSICMGAPFYVLGPLVTDIAPGYDHITGAIGGAVAAMNGAAFLCYVTPAEHLALPNVDDVKQGIIASKIAAHAADIAKGVPGARDIDDRMADARRRLDWDGQFACALDPETAKAIRDSRSPEDDHSDTCSMCGKFCAVRSMNKALAGEYIDIL